MGEIGLAAQRRRASRKARGKEGAQLEDNVWWPKQEMMVTWERVVDVTVENKRS